MVICFIVLLFGFLCCCFGFDFVGCVGLMVLVLLTIRLWFVCFAC